MLKQRCKPSHPPVLTRNGRSPIVFVTVCADNHRPLFNRPEAMPVVVQSWKKAKGWVVGKYVLMPTHIHFFASPIDDHSPTLNRWITYWKALVSKSWPWPDEHPIWQQDYWDRQLRSDEHYATKWEYVQQNPVRRGLVSDARDWPFQGEISFLE
jgi:REP element-mobilizing transposase RayT